ncbi:MAG: PfkB family carbohydrate kinase [Anaerolineae bacterium]|nr:PfkB family carbohydrate kinase [Anaerolineae bacterium]
MHTLNPESAKQVLPSTGHPQVVGLGMTTLDVLMRLDTMPTWERGTRIKDFRFEGGGPVGTAMVAAAKLGARVGFVGTAGNDSTAELKLQSMIDVGIDLSHLVRRNGPEDQVVFVYVHAQTGERIFSGVERWGDQSLQPYELDQGYITGAEMLHLEGFHPRAAMQAAQWMQQAGKKVVLDGSKTSGPVKGTMRELVQYVDVLISGSGFVQGLTGLKDRDSAMRAVLDIGPNIIVQTEGEDGAYTVTKDDSFHTPAFRCKVIDTTGAGDVFHGAYIVGLLHQWSLRDITIFATAVSAIKCGSLGGRPGIPTFDQVIRYLEKHGVDVSKYKK